MLNLVYRFTSLEQFYFDIGAFLSSHLVSKRTNNVCKFIATKGASFDITAGSSYEVMC